MSAQLSIADVLDRAADLIAPEGAWTQGSYARDKDGDGIADGRNPKARCWCMIGALEKVSGGLVGRDLAGPIYDALGLTHHASIADWNDADGRGQAEVVAKLREAAALARSQQSSTAKGGE